MDNPAVFLKHQSIILLGASFTTGNLGVSALAWSSLKMLKTRWPDAKIVLLGSGRHPDKTFILLDGQKEEVLSYPVRYSPNLLVEHHILRLCMVVLLYRCLPFLKKWLDSKHMAAKELMNCDRICDITGGDSFSDLYGFKRFFRGYLLKRICQMSGRPFLLLPQTYGPFTSPVAQILARHVLNKSQIIYSRDDTGISVVEKLIGPTQKCKLCPDVAFCLTATRPDTAEVENIEQLKMKGKQIIGLNISGLLYHGGYTKNNMFDLADDYPSLINDIILSFGRKDDLYVLLVPHVLPSAEFAVEDDYVAANKVFLSLPQEIRDKTILLEKGYDQSQTKYVIGLCDFFLGSRMHATIAALSQNIPAVGLAYSRKFSGVFKTADVEDCVLDLRKLSNKNTLEKITEIYVRRSELHEILKKKIPAVKAQLATMFDDQN